MVDYRSDYADEVLDAINKVRVESGKSELRSAFAEASNDHVYQTVLTVSETGGTAEAKDDRSDDDAKVAVMAALQSILASDNEDSAAVKTRNELLSE